ncbi:MAG: N-acetylmuramoyl-L-alanine amidase family protein, partial [Acutalibacteraceae bacterium]
SVNARAGSTVTASFDGKTITLKNTKKQNEETEIQNNTFLDYSGSFTMPENNSKDINLGKVTVTAVLGGNTETRSSGNITCKKAVSPVIAEVVNYAAETFNGETADDMSRPTNSYLPKGTVDYVVGNAYNDGKEYLKLRCGKRVYVTKKNATETAQVTKQYAGKLADTNKISVASVNISKQFTEITFNTDWKAPFFFDLLPQSYYNPSVQDYRISSVTAKYVEITFCYATDIAGKIDFGSNNPIFSSYEISKSGSNYKLRLNLRKTGTFYGWNAEYNSKGQLVFTFLHPAQVKAASNKYGADLTGVKIMIDVGHGGSDSGAVGIGNLYEKNINLSLAKLLKAELESMGATVIMNRSGDTTLNPDQRCMKLIDTKPDFCIAIHHDANTSAKPNGFGAFYSTIFSSDAAKLIYNSTIKRNIYNANAQNNRNRLEWHYYYVARTTVCPVVLTENGFVTSIEDYPGIISADVNRKKAEALAEGIAKYFLSIKNNLPVDDIDSSNPEPPYNPQTPSSVPSGSSSDGSSSKPETVSSDNSSYPSGNPDDSDSSKSSGSGDSSENTSTQSD